MYHSMTRIRHITKAEASRYLQKKCSFLLLHGQGPLKTCWASTQICSWTLGSEQPASLGDVHGKQPLLLRFNVGWPRDDLLTRHIHTIASSHPEDFWQHAQQALSQADGPRHAPARLKETELY